MLRGEGRAKGAKSVRLSPEAKQLLALLAERGGISQAAVVDTLIREEARRESIALSDAAGDRQTTARERFLTLVEQAHRHDPGDLTPEELEREVTLADEEAREILRARRR